MIGQQIGNYRLVRLLGSGGMGMVYEAVHDGIGGRAAIKVLRPEVAINKDATQRFFSEARAANLIAHPGIVHIFDCGYTASGVAFLAMEFLHGETLRQRLDRLRTLTVSETIRMARQVAGTLNAAHQRAVVHRDLKPDNLMIVQDPELPGGERVKLLDFGVAKIAEGMAEKTKTGTVMGTPAYMAPEQCRDAKLATDRSDVYSLGIILYQCLAGQPPFVGEYVVDVLAMHMMQEPRPLTDYNPRVQKPMVAFVHRMLEKEPTRRPSMDEVVRELQRLLDQLRRSQTQVSQPPSVSLDRPPMQPSAPEGIRQHLQAPPGAAFAPQPNRVTETSDEIASRQTEPLSIIHLRRSESNNDPDRVRSASDTRSADASNPSVLHDHTGMVHPSTEQLPRARSSPHASVVPSSTAGLASTNSGSYGRSQPERSHSARYWASRMSALALVLGLSIYASRRTNSTLVRSSLVHSVDAGSVVSDAPIGTGPPTDMAVSRLDLDPREQRRLGPRAVIRNDALSLATTAYLARNWTDAARHASACENRGVAKYKCPWILGMATCQLLKMDPMLPTALLLHDDLLSALDSLREQNQPNLAEEIENACATLGVSIGAKHESLPSQEKPEIRNPFR